MYEGVPTTINDPSYLLAAKLPPHKTHEVMETQELPKTAQFRKEFGKKWTCQVGKSTLKLSARAQAAIKDLTSRGICWRDSREFVFAICTSDRDIIADDNTVLIDSGELFIGVGVVNTNG